MILISDVLFAVYLLHSSYISKSIKNYYVYLLVSNILMLIYTATFLIFDYSLFHVKSILTYSLNPYTLILLTVSAVSYICVNFFRINALTSKNNISAIVTILSISSIFTMIIGWIFFNYIITSKLLLGFFLIIISIVLITFDFRNFRIRLSKELIFALASSLSLGISISIDSRNISQFSPIMYTLFVSFVQFAVLAGILRNSIYSGVKEIFSTLKVHILLNPLFLTLSYLVNLLAFTPTNRSTIIALSSLSTIIAGLLAIVVFKEREKLKEKVIALVLVVIGSILI